MPLSDAEKHGIENAVAVLQQMVDHLAPQVAVIKRFQAKLTQLAIAQQIVTQYDQCVLYLADGLRTDVHHPEPNVSGIQTKLNGVQETLRAVFHSISTSGISQEAERLIEEEKAQELGPKGTSVQNIHSTTVKVACRTCGAPHEPNELMQCIPCIRDSSTFGEEIPRRLVVSACRHCQRWNRKGSTWAQAALESNELMAILLNKISILKQYELQECKFLWTEPNSMRIKMQLVIRKRVLGDTVLDKTIVLEWVMTHSICPDCERSFTPQTWKALVALRQHSHTKGTLRQLEDTIRKHDAQNRVVGIETHKDGFDLAFAKRQDAEKFVSFCKHHFVVKHSMSEQLISHNVNDNTANKKFSHAVMLAPISKGDLVYIEKGILNRYGNCPQLMVCTRVTTSITLMDPFTLRAVDVSPETYWKYPCRVVSTTGHLSTFLVHDVEEIELDRTMRTTTNPRYFDGGRGVGRVDKETAAMSIATSRFKPEALSFSRYRPCEVEIAKEGAENTGVYETFRVKCHLGLHIKPGDTVEGYDLRHSVINFNETNDAVGEEVLQKLPGDIMLVRIKKRLKADGIAGPHQAQSSRLRMEAMKEQAGRARKDFGDMDMDMDLQERKDEFEMFDELDQMMSNMQI